MENTYPEPYRSAPKDSLVDPSTCYSRECVSYCAWKIAEITGNWLKRTGSMNAREWVYRLPENGFAEIDTPHAHCIGVLERGEYGHVIFVESVDNDTITISEYNYNFNGDYNTREINLTGCPYRWYEIEKLPATDEIDESAPDTSAGVPTTAPVTGFVVGDTVAPTRLVSYDGVSLRQWDRLYTLSELVNDRAVLTARGQVWAAMNIADIVKV